MSSNSLLLFARTVGPLGASAVAYMLWRFIERAPECKRNEAFLILCYAVTRLALWVLFAVYMQDYVTSSDPRLFYIPQLEHFLRGDVPIRDFYYPYAPLLMPTML